MTPIASRLRRVARRRLAVGVVLIVLAFGSAWQHAARTLHDHWTNEPTLLEDPTQDLSKVGAPTSGAEGRGD